MIPEAHLHRLLRTLTSTVRPNTLQRMSVDGLAIYADLDDQDFATLARIVSGEAFEEATSG